MQFISLINTKNLQTDLSEDDCELADFEVAYDGDATKHEGLPIS
jgi:hypothetical protein